VIDKQALFGLLQFRDFTSSMLTMEHPETRKEVMRGDTGSTNQHDSTERESFTRVNIEEGEEYV
jgi:hypothetical protein